MDGYTVLGCLIWQSVYFAISLNFFLQDALQSQRQRLATRCFVENRHSDGVFIGM
ncbi:hypothetical protein ACSYAD_31300 [Acaryochloris marina NIES-2412]|uniref:hypothetical protein n=1 Tax=Acaryochloris marina TaxID=155978 RepID=UPI0040598D41